MWLIEHNAMKPDAGVKKWLRVFLTSTLDGDEWSTSRCVLQHKSERDDEAKGLFPRRELNPSYQASTQI
jgi:uncharacterized protein YndB with AHSA1/START domain